MRGLSCKLNQVTKRLPTSVFQLPTSNFQPKETTNPKACDHLPTSVSHLFPVKPPMCL